MKKIITLLLLVMAFTGYTIAAYAAGADQALTLTGSIVDSQCAGHQTPEQLASFVKGHTKSCALMPGCAASGYNIFADNQLYKFDKESNAKIVKFLNEADSSLDVKVVAKKSGDLLTLVSIENQR
jgi:hypothetical protein